MLMPRRRRMRCAPTRSLAFARGHCRHLLTQHRASRASTYPALTSAKPPERARQSFRSSRAMRRQGRARAWRLLVPLVSGACASSPVEAALGPDHSRRRSGCSRKAISTASENAGVTRAAGCSMIAARTTAGGGAKWRSAAIAPSSVDLRRGGVRLEAPPGLSPDCSDGHRNACGLFAGLGDGPGAALPDGLAGAHAARGADRHSGASA